MHLLIYNRRPEVNAVVPRASADGHGARRCGNSAQQSDAQRIDYRSGLHPGGAVRHAGHARNFPTRWSRMVQHYDAILLANHGVVTCGPDLLTAFFRMETVEHFAQVSLMTEMLGKQVLLSGRDVEKLLVGPRALRHHHGVHHECRDVRSPATTRRTSEAKPDRISITREELEALIEEAVRKDRALR